MGRVTNSIQKQVVDENGHVRYSETTNTVNWGKEPEYIKLYLKDVLYLSDLPKGLNSVLYAFLKRMSYGNQLVLNASLKRQIAKELGLGMSSINNAVSKFVKGNLLIREDVGLYRVNPHLFGKGDWKEIAKIRLTVTYDMDGRTLMAEVDRTSDESTPDEAEPHLEAEKNNELDEAQRFYEEFEESRETEEEGLYL